MKTEYKAITIEIRDGLAVLTMNNPPVNQLSPDFSKELKEAITGAFNDPDIKALILTGTGKNFIAGADITQIYKVKERETILPVVLEMARFLNRIEQGPKPLIAAINGNALGGGLEIAMACHYRVAAKGASLGQPEVQIGVIPGAGGTQRLPRLIGLPNALEMITVGKPITAEKAYSRGLVDEVVSQEVLLDTALKAARRFISGELNLRMRMTRNINDRIPSAAEKQALLNYSKMMAAQKAKGYIAPFKALEAVEKGLSYDIEADIEREVGLFSDCAVTDVAKNLMGIFLNTRAAGRLPRIKGIEPAKIRKVSMLGGGVMGSGIVNLLLSGGFDAVLWDINDEALDKGVTAIRKTFAYPIKKKKMTQTDLDRMIQDHLTTTTSLEDIKEVDLVIEAVLEDMKIKQDIWKQLEGICRSDAIFGTNTSALPITQMASVLADPGRMIGLHFFNPAHRMQLLEIICAEKTSDQTLSTSVAFARAIKKVPIVVNDGPGFYVSRQLGGLMAGFMPLVAGGVDPAVIEEAMVDFGMPMGPATLSDLTGIDINYHVGKTFERTMGERYEMHPLTELIFQTGCYGRKTGAGYFDYSGKKPVPNPKVFKVIENYLKENGISPKEMSNQEIVDLMLANAINEAAYMIQERICDRPQDMDLAMIYGTGFPPYRGGILRYADAWEIRNVYEYLVKQEAELGVRFKPATLLMEMAESGDTFYKE
ncbi:MAG: enoyl-CoA hydratase/isomerase family protein [Deltaproteobacteria bacterium]|nr:enoyl-CoA hydratase/isomerase family protein [Deltaproteobacteria bacterium]MBW1736335.1 enoyl-CoA hydratase/isomerase family protein [Deltaproteobacteria bacterium]MBW1909068.1 enoyl-CoA hydratase/isomerase family protein [Deltaproteobacteria bacterium]MBW2032497.1 enoyl-CoA hydratase/isomerase family protein [Deltaproteobacteria bacterium]MBW2113423.1 enoyl-CoA hydratase/isomerase family protein [Deltaproteobacteria bacterium]